MTEKFAQVRTVLCMNKAKPCTYIAIQPLVAHSITIKFSRALNYTVNEHNECDSCTLRP